MSYSSQHNNSPFELETYLKSLLGNQYDAFVTAEEEPVSIRTNTLKCTSSRIQQLLEKFHYNQELIPFNSDGFILKSDPLPLSHSLAFFEGMFHYQGISSQLPALILDVKPRDRILDMTAAPGSKSSQLAALLNQTGELILNDSSYRRLKALQAILQRSGAVNQIILQQRGENLSRIYPAYFDKILLDAPCTALGTYASIYKKYGWWSAKKLEKLSNLQYQLMVSAIKCLKTGGDIVYSTCSIAPEENEFMIDRIIKRFPVSVEDISIDLKSKFETGWLPEFKSEISDQLEKSLRIWPQIHGLEGFYVIKLKKTAEVSDEKTSDCSQFNTTLSAENSSVVPILEHMSTAWGIDQDVWKNYRYLLKKTRLWMMSPNIEYVPVENFVSAGLLLAEKRLSGWKLVNGSAQFLSKHITNRRLSLTDYELKNLFREGKVIYHNLFEDYYVLEYKDRIIGSIYHEHGSLRMHLPHLFTRIAFETDYRV